MPKTAYHNLSHYRLLTGDMGYLLPCGVTEVLPGDRFTHNSRALLRVQPLVKPVMHPVSVSIHHWFVPNRLLWSSWDDFITRSDDQLAIPTIALTAPAIGSLADHLGVPCDGTTDYTVSELPFRAYNMIYNHAYRDKDVITEVAEDSTTLQRVCWEKDRFTTARANPQQGTSVTIPFQAGSHAPVRGIGLWDNVATNASWSETSGDVHESGGVDTTPANTDGNRWHAGSADATIVVRQDADDTAYPDIYADLAAATGAGIDINEFREALAQQSFLEHRNRYGSTFEDYLRYLGITPRDSRLQQPEYLGGGKNTISFSEVLSTSDAGTLNVGDLAGHGISGLSHRPYRRTFTEHGYVISLISVRPRAIYTQMLPKHFSRSTSWDFWQKELEAMGPQEVYTKEIYGPTASGTTVFGYNGRHDDYRHLPSYVSGEFRDGGTEADWHYGRDFSSAPSLNSTFLNCVPTDRVYADTSTPELYLNVSHNIKARRLVSSRARH